MAYPRVCALAEVAWTPQNERSWPDFRARLRLSHLARLDAAGIAYRLEPPKPRQFGSRVSAIYEDGEVRYTLDGSEPGPNSPLYTGAFDLPKGAVLKMRGFRSDGRSSPTITGAQPGPTED
jgi:hexosaminidase